MNGNGKLGVTLAMVLVVLSACTKTRTDRTERITHDRLGQTTSERMSNLRSSVVSLQHTLSQMPTDDESKDRALTLEALGSAASALAAIEGPQPSGSFRQQLRVIESDRTQVQHAGPAVPTEPAVDSALRATYNALVSLRDGRFAGNQQIANEVNEVGQKIPQLDTVRGPLHTLAVVDVLNAASRALVTMTDIIENRGAAQTRPVRGAR